MFDASLFTSPRVIACPLRSHLTFVTHFFIVECLAGV